MGGWYDFFVVLSLTVVIILAIVALVFLSRFEDVETDDATLSIVAGSSGASLSTSPTVGLQFVSSGNGISMSINGFSSTLVGASSYLTTQVTIPDDFLPNVELTFPIIVENAGTFILGTMHLRTDGILEFYAGTSKTDLFAVGSVGVPSTGMAWTQDL